MIVLADLVACSAVGQWWIRPRRANVGTLIVYGGLCTMEASRRRRAFGVVTAGVFMYQWMMIDRKAR